MGIYAETNAEIICKDKETTEQVYLLLKKTGEGEDAELDPEKLEKGDTFISFYLASGRIQNLEWQCEQIWEKIKDIPGVESMECPFMAEADGMSFYKDTNNKESDE